MLAVLCESDARDELRVSEHGGHALAGVVVVDGDGLVGAGGGGVDAAAVERHLDERAVVAVRALERSERKGEKVAMTINAVIIYHQHIESEGKDSNLLKVHKVVHLTKDILSRKSELHLTRVYCSTVVYILLMVCGNI